MTVTVMVPLSVPQLLATEYCMVAVPGETPVTTPELLTVATEVLLDVHEPPVSPFELIVLVLPTQIF